MARTDRQQRGEGGPGARPVSAARPASGAASKEASGESVASACRPDPRRPLRRHLAALALLVVALAPGCSDEASGARSFARLRLRPAAGATPVELPRTVAQLDILDGSGTWEIEAPDSREGFLPGPSRDDARRVLQVQAERTNQLVRVTHRGALDPSTFNEVRVPVQLSGHGGVRLEFHRDGETVAQTDATLLHSGNDVALVTVPIPLDVRAAGPFDALALRLDGDARTYRLRGVELRLVSPALLLPDPALPPELVLVDGEARRGTGVCSGRPVTTSFTVPPDSVLEFSCAVPPSVRVARATGLEVELRPADGPPKRHTVNFTADASEASHWRKVRMPLDDLQGQQVTAEFSMTGPGLERDGVQAGCVVAEVTLSRPAEGAAGAAPRHPDVLLITSDTHRGDHLGAARSGVVIETPHLDALAACGLLFTDCDTPVNVTNPSHMGLMTGVHPRDLGILDNTTALSDAAPTLAEAFRDAGYLTWAVLSTEHLGPRGSGLGQGFDRASWPPHVPRPASDTVDIAERWLPDRDERPLFLWVHVFDAHWKYEPPPDFDRMYYPSGADPRDPDLPPLGLPEGVLPPDMEGLRDLEFPRAQYRAEISSLDHELARLLERAPFRDGVVAFVGDHGESLGQHGIWFNHDGLYPDVLHIPLIVAGPGVPVGERTAAPVTHLDLGRTLLDLAGLRAVDFPGRELPLVGTADGASDGATGRLPAAAGPAASRDGPPRFALGSDGTSAAVSWRGLLLILQLHSYRTPRMEAATTVHETLLFDLAADPGCDHDLVASRPDDARQLRKRLIEWLRAAEDRGWSAAASADPVALEQLSQLGYAGGLSSAPRRALWVDDDCDWCRRLR